MLIIRSIVRIIIYRLYYYYHVDNYLRRLWRRVLFPIQRVCVDSSARIHIISCVHTILCSPPRSDKFILLDLSLSFSLFPPLSFSFRIPRSLRGVREVECKTFIVSGPYKLRGTGIAGLWMASSFVGYARMCAPAATHVHAWRVLKICARARLPRVHLKLQQQQQPSPWERKWDRLRFYNTQLDTACCFTGNSTQKHNRICSDWEEDRFEISDRKLSIK